MLVNGKALADMNGTSTRVHWRGYYTSVKPKTPPFSKEDLRKELSKALLSIKIATDEERKVIL